MNFLYPAFLLGALAVAVPIVLHLLRRDVAPDLPFTAVRLLKKSPVERSRKRRLRDVLLLAARVVALLLLATAFARPYAPSAESAALPLRIVAVDRSFSMGAPGRFERARQLAQSAIEEAGFRERVTLLAFDDRVEVVTPPGNPGEAKAALAALEPGHGGTRYASVMSKAAELAGGGTARLVVITDLQRAGWEGEGRARVPASLQVEVRDAGAPPANAALVAARLQDQRLVATIRNASATARSGAVVLGQDNREAARAVYTAPPSTTVEVVLPWKPVHGGATVSIDDPGGFPADDRRYLVVGATPSPSVLIVTSPDSPGLYMQRALEVAESDDAPPLRPRIVSPAEIAGGRAGTIARHRAIVLLSTRTLDRQARDGIAAFVRSGGGLFVAAAPDVEPAALAAMFGWKPSTFAADNSQRQLSLTATDIRHPIFRPFGGLAANLGQIRFSRAWRVIPDDWHVPARFDDGTPAVVERSEGQGRVLLFASDLDRRWNDFPLHPAFVPFVVEAVRYVASRASEPVEYVVGRSPAGASGEPGIHQLEGRLIAVNVDNRESSTSAMTAEEFASILEAVPQARVDAGAVREQAEARQSLWQYGLMLMLCVLVTESIVGRA